MSTLHLQLEMSRFFLSFFLSIFPQVRNGYLIKETALAVSLLYPLGWHRSSPVPAASPSAAAASSAPCFASSSNSSCRTLFRLGSFLLIYLMSVKAVKYYNSLVSVCLYQNVGSAILLGALKCWEFRVQNCWELKNVGSSKMFGSNAMG